jgi:hypothetical protein
MLMTAAAGGMPSAAPIPETESTRLHNQAHRSRRQLQLVLPSVPVVRAAHPVKCTCHSANLDLTHSPRISLQVKRCGYIKLAHADCRRISSEDLLSADISK